MPRQYLRTARWIVMPVFLACLAAGALALRADPTPGKQDQVVAQLVCQYLQRGHLSRPEINDELCQRLFRKFIKTFDPTKVYFTKSDIEFKLAWKFSINRETRNSNGKSGVRDQESLQRLDGKVNINIGVRARNRDQRHVSSQRPECLS